MFLYKGGQTVKKGTYWESEKNAKIVLEDEGVLPGGTKELYFRLPESYALIPIVLIGLALSMAFPYGAGFLLFITLIALSAALYAAGSATTRLLKKCSARTPASVTARPQRTWRQKRPRSGKRGKRLKRRRIPVKRIRGGTITLPPTER
jgi:hypothetical protein